MQKFISTKSFICDSCRIEEHCEDYPIGWYEVCNLHGFGFKTYYNIKHLDFCGNCAIKLKHNLDLLNILYVFDNPGLDDAGYFYSGRLVIT